MAVTVDPPGFTFKPNGLKNRLDKEGMLRQTRMDYIPLDGRGYTLRTRPLVEDEQLNWREEYIRAAKILMTNPLIYVATNLLSDSISDADFIVQEKQGNTWVKHENNPLNNWFEMPNQTMDKIEFIKAYVTHLVNFGKVQIGMFQKGDILPDGSNSTQNNVFDIIFPTRILKITDNPNVNKYYYAPLRRDTTLLLNGENVYVDVKYNPSAREVGVALPNNPLRLINEIYMLYVDVFHHLFMEGGIATYVLKRIIDTTKDPLVYAEINDQTIEEQIQKIYAQIGLRGTHRNSIVGLKGDWDLKQIGTPLEKIMNKEIIQWIETLISAVYGVPASLFWAGLSNSNQRASRQMDSLDFYNNTVHRMLGRISRNLGQYLVPLFLGSKWKERFMIAPDVTNMPLAQYVRAKDNRETERWWQLGIINKGYTYERLGLDASYLTSEDKKEYYNDSIATLNIGRGDQSIENQNGLE